jgi:hypothetical protein
LKKFELLNTSADLIEPELLILSNKLIYFPLMLIVLKRGTTPLLLLCITVISNTACCFCVEHQTQR